MKSKGEIVTEENKLISQFKKMVTGAFWEDGIVDPDVYLKHSPRILYILKEANADGESGDLRKFLRDGGRAQTWNPVARWNYAVFNNFPNWNDVDKQEMGNLRKKWLSYCAVINLKKSPGEGSADRENIESSIQNDGYKRLLQKQILNYKPELIICCGTGNLVNQVLKSQLSTDWSRSRLGVWYSKMNLCKGFIIHYLHPQARLKSNFMHFMLTDTINELMKKIKL